MGKACESHWQSSAKPCTRKMLYSGEGVLPHPRARFPRGGACVCAGVRALACVCMGVRGRTCVGVCVCELSSACACVRVLRVGGAAVLYACLFCSLVNSLACHLSAYGYLLAIRLITCGVYDALCYPLAIQLLSH